MGAAPELPPGALVDALAGEDLRGDQRREHGRAVQALAHVSAVARVSGVHPPKRGQDDERTPAGSTG